MQLICYFTEAQFVGANNNSQKTPSISKTQMEIFKTKFVQFKASVNKRMSARCLLSFGKFLT